MSVIREDFNVIEGPVTRGDFNVIDIVESSGFGIKEETPRWSVKESILGDSKECKGSSYVPPGGDSLNKINDNLSNSKSPIVGNFSVKAKYRAHKHNESVSNILNTKKADLLILFFNARSLVNKVDELKILVKEKKPDIIGIIETWLTDSISDGEISISDYTFVRRDRKSDTKTKGGGVIVYIRDDLSFIDRTGDFYVNMDYLWIRSFDGKRSIINLGIFYRPPDSSETQLTHLLSEFKKYQGADTIILGDFNFPDINWKNSTSGSEGKQFLTEVSSLALTQCVKTSTRLNNILDLVLVYDRSLVNNVTQLAPVAKSDHNTLLVKLDVNFTNHNKLITRYRYDKANYKILQYRLNKINWIQLLDERGMEEGWTTLIKILTDFKENHIPRVKLGEINSYLWYSNRIRKLIKTRNNLFKRAQKTGLYHFRVRYKKLRNQITSLIRKAKSKFEDKIIKRSRNNRKIFYSYINTKNRKGGIRKVGPLLKPNTSGSGEDIVIENIEMAGIFNDYFVSVFNKNQPNRINLNWLRNDFVSDGVTPTIIVTQKMIWDIIGALKMNKSPGIDNITSTYILKMKDVITYPLVQIFNWSFQHNEIPSDWKKQTLLQFSKKVVES